MVPHLSARDEVVVNSGLSNIQHGNSDGASTVPDNGQNSSEDNLNDSGDSDDLDRDSDDEGWAAELMLLTTDRGASADSGTPWPVIFRRWIMSLVDHFTSVRVLERACVEISLTLLGVDHRRATLPDWDSMEDFLRKLTYSEIKEHRDEYIKLLKGYIKEYEPEDALPGTAARHRDTFFLPFRRQLKPDPAKPPPPSQMVTTCLHCEAILIAVMTYLAGDSEHELGLLFEARSSLPPIVIVS